MDKERILCSAINYNGTIICGRRHGDCYKVLRALVPSAIEPERDKQGFLTSTNRFVDRKEALQIALDNNQVIYGKEQTENELVSENLYFDETQD